jgi:hypothetical protein
MSSVIFCETNFTYIEIVHDFKEVWKATGNAVKLIDSQSITF